ncbi:MAG: tetratricopeptide repeat protein [Chloroflexi bacterium]|nr:tetratricopeptide repeat protein [Chloroflexota bacterium]
MYSDFPIYDVPQQNIIQRFFAQRWSAIVIEIVMTIVITVAAGAAFDFFDPFDGSQETSAATNASENIALDDAGALAGDPLQFIRGRGVDYFRARRLAAAEAMYDWAIALRPDDQDSYSWRGYVRMRRSDYFGAQADYRRLLEFEQNAFDGHNALCWAYGETRYFASALTHCERALALAVSTVELASALENRCWLRVELGDYAGATRDCRLVLTLSSGNGDVEALAHYNLGRVLMAEGETGAALPQFEEALRIGSSYAKMYLDISRIYDTLGYKWSAQASYEQVRQLAARDRIVVQAQG